MSDPAMDVERAVKYALDRVFAIALLIVLGPLLLAIALAIRLDSPGSPIFLQERAGTRGRPFTIFKYRTMKSGAATHGLGFTTAADDERITRIGAFLRRTGLDELPQLLNIALGEMSFVGPRPTFRYQVGAYTPRQRRRLLFRPGVTGWAQVNGRNSISWAERIELDLHYVHHYSLWLDFVILGRTLAVLRRGQGVYAADAANDAFVNPPSSPAATAQTPPAVAVGTTPPVTVGTTPPVAVGTTPPVAVGTTPSVAVTPRVATPAPTAAAAAPADTGTRSDAEVGGEGAPPLVVIGAGGHARVVIDALEKQGKFEITGVLDDSVSGPGATVLGYTVLGGRGVLGWPELPRRAVVAIGSPSGRGAWIAHLARLGFELPVIVHPGAEVGRDVEIGAGTVLFAGAIVNAGARLGRGVIVNSGASVDHDCVLGDLVHVSPGAHLAGNVRVGERSHIGIGACVIQGLEIGADVIIGAGAAVVSAIPAGTTAVGVPARAVSTDRPAPPSPQAAASPLPRS